MTLFDQTLVITPSNKKPFSERFRRLCRLLARKRSLETHLVAEKNREQARRAVDQLLKSSGHWPMG